MNRLETFLEKKSFLYGINLPWFAHDSYGCDIGYAQICNPQAVPEQDCRFRESLVRECFANCRYMGFNCARIWLFEIMEGTSLIQTVSLSMCRRFSCVTSLAFAK